MTSWRDLPLAAKVAIAFRQAIWVAVQVLAIAVVVSLPLLLTFAVAGGSSSVLDKWWGSDMTAVTVICVVDVVIVTGIHSLARRSRPHQFDLAYELIGGVFGVAVLFVVWRRLFGWALDTGRLAVQIPLVVIMGLLSLLLLVGTVGLPGRIAQRLGRKIRPGPSTSAGWHRIHISVWPAWVGVGLIAFGTVNAFLLRVGIAGAPTQPHDGYDLVLAAVVTEFISLLKGVPVLDIPDSLRLRPPLAYTDPWTGVNQILFKLAVVAPMIPVAIEVVRRAVSRIGPEPDAPARDE